MAFPGTPAHREVYQDYYWDNTYSVWRQYVETPNVTHITTTTTINTDSSLIYVDPTAGAVDLTLPAAPFIGKKQRVIIKHLSYGLIANGDCESTSPPSMNSETPYGSGVATFVQDPSFAHTGANSFKFTDTDGAGGSWYFHDSGADLHGLTAGQTYTLSAWYYVPTASGIAPDEAGLWVYDSTNSAFLAQTEASELDKWEKLSVTFTIPSSGTTNVGLYVHSAGATAAGEYFHVDDIKLYRHYPVTIKTPINKDLVGVHSIELNSDEDYAEIIWNGNNFSLTEYYDHGQNTNGDWRREADGTMECTEVFAIGATATNGALTFPQTFNATPVINWTPDCLTSETEASSVANRTATGFTWSLKATLGSARDGQYVAKGRWKK